MSASKQITVFRDYQAAPDMCAQALRLLLKKSPSKEAPEPVSRDDTKESESNGATRPKYT